jgi:hypothetical protein
MLEGEAKKATAGYTATEQDYPLIVELLQKEFGDSDLVAESLHHELYNLAPPKNDKTSLRNFARQLDRICRQLGQQGLDEDAPALLMTAKGKLPSRVRTTLLEKEQDARDQGSPKWNMADFRTALGKHVRIREDADRCEKAAAAPRTAPLHFGGGQSNFRHKPPQVGRGGWNGRNRSRSREPATTRTFSATVSPVRQQPQRQQSPRTSQNY